MSKQYPLIKFHSIGITESGIIKEYDCVSKYPKEIEDKDYNIEMSVDRFGVIHKRIVPKNKTDINASYGKK